MSALMTAEQLMFASIDQDLVRVDRITDDTDLKRERLISDMEVAVSNLALAGDVKPEQVELNLKVINTYIKLLDSRDAAAAKRALVKLKKGEVDNIDNASQVVGDFLRKITPGYGKVTLPSEIPNMAEIDQMLEARLAEEGKEIPETVLRTDPNDYR